MTQGDYIKKARLDAGVTQEELANAVGTTKQTIHKYEQDIVTNIPMDRTKAMADFLGVTPSQLLGWDTEFWSDVVGNNSKSENNLPDEATLKLAEELRNRPGMRLLFDAAKSCKEEDLINVADFISKLRKGDDD